MDAVPSATDLIDRLHVVALPMRLRFRGITVREVALIEGPVGWGEFGAFLEYGPVEAAAWLASQKVVAVGTDNWAVEVIPSENPKHAFPVHAFLLTDNGIHIIENVRTDLIAAEAASTKRATFFVNMTVPKAVGLTGNFVAVDAIQ